MVVNGYEWFYASKILRVDENPIPSDDSDEVVDILSMYRHLKDSHEKLPDINRVKIGVDDVAFEGFDANDIEEHNALGFARFFCREGSGNFEESKEEIVNSHSPMLPIYRSMLKKWAEVKGRDKYLTVEKIQAILDAQRISR